MQLLFTRFLPAIIYLIAITILFLLPGSTLDINQDWYHKYHIDKLVHFVIFLMLVFLFCRPIQLKGHFTKAITIVYFIIFMASIIYGFIIELLQKAIPNRGFDWLDLAADAVGAYIGYRIAKQQLKKVKPATIEELKKEAVDYAKKYVGDKVGIIEKMLPKEDKK